MKKILTCLVLATSVATVSHAQLQKGNVLVGGDLANFNIGLEKNAGFSITLDPKAAWFINGNTAVGAYASLGISKANKNSATVTSYAVGPLARYYVTDPKVTLLQHGRFFFEGNIGVEGRNVSDGGGSTNGLGFGVGPGYAYFITPSIGLETLLKYNGLTGFGDEGYQSNLNFNVGFQIYLPGRATRDRIMRDERK